MHTLGINMDRSLTQQPYGTVGTSIRYVSYPHTRYRAWKLIFTLHQGATLFPEFEPYRGAGYWPIQSFILKILRSSSNTYKARLRKQALGQGNQEPEQDEDIEFINTSLVIDPPAEPFPGGVNNPDATMAPKDNLMGHLTEEVTRMALDPNKSTNTMLGE
jgi:hypothetical protein